MSDFDIFCNNLLEEAKRFREKVKEEKCEDGKRAYRHASVLLAICSLEAYINNISDEITIAEDFPINYKALLLEKDLVLDKGEFKIRETLKMSRLTDKIEILFRRHKNAPLNAKHEWWPVLKHGIEIRNKITHPKDEVNITDELLEKIIQAVIDCLSEIFFAVYKRKFPQSHLSLISKLSF